MNLASAEAAFERWGEISSIKLLPGSKPATVSVTYFDVRAALFAIDMLGGLQYCRPGPQNGDRIVRVPGDFHVCPEHYPMLADWPQEEAGTSSYILQFFDVRDAERIRSASTASEQDDELEPPPGLEHLAPPPGLPRSEAASGQTGLTDVTNTLAPKRSFVVMVVNLPNMLCSNACLEATLQQADLQGSVNSFTTKSGKPCGEATIWLSTAEAAEHCLAHFQGRRWHGEPKKGAQQKEVQAWILHHASTGKLCRNRKRCDTGVSAISTDVGGPSDEEEAQEERLDAIAIVD